MTHDQVCAIKAVQSAVALARKVGVTEKEIQEAVGSEPKTSVGAAQVESRPSITELHDLDDKT
jgi:hypothetical protein